MQQAMRIEGVVDAVAFVEAEFEADGGAACTDVLAIAGGMLRRQTIFFGEMFGDALALGHHVGIQFKWLEMNIGGSRIAEAPDGVLQGFKADHAPGAGHIGNEIDFDRGIHGGPHKGLVIVDAAWRRILKVKMRVAMAYSSRRAKPHAEGRAAKTFRRATEI